MATAKKDRTDTQKSTDFLKREGRIMASYWWFAVLAVIAGLVLGVIAFLDEGSVFIQGFFSAISAALIVLGLLFWLKSDFRFPFATAWIPWLIAAIIITMTYPSYTY